MRDLPVLWATPSPSGFMMTCPSVLGPGRSEERKKILKMKLLICKIFLSLGVEQHHLFNQKNMVMKTSVEFEEN